MKRRKKRQPTLVVVHELFHRDGRYQAIVREDIPIMPQDSHSNETIGGKRQ